MIECKDAEYILAIAQYKTISAAAKALFISQPALTKYLKSLEERIGVILFDRSKKKLLPSAAGERYLRYASELIAIKQRLEKEIQCMKDEVNSHLRIGFPCTGMRYVILDAVKILRHRRPSTEITLIELTSPEIEQCLINHTIDIGIISMPCNTQTLESQLLFEEKLLLGVPKDHPMLIRGNHVEGRYPWIDLTLFHNDFFVLRNKGTHFYAVTDNLFKQCSFEPRVFLYTRNHYSTIELARMNHMLFFIPESFVQNVKKSDDIQFFTVGAPTTKISSGIIYRKDDHLEMSTLEFMHIINTLLNNHKYTNGDI